MKAKLIVHAPCESEGRLRLSASLIEPDGSKEELWWELPAGWGDAVTQSADPWIIGLLFPIMQRARDVHVEGRASPSLLANLDLFMRTWQVWSPQDYFPVNITADDEMELAPVSQPGLAVTAFSCGVDSCFTAYRHARRLVGRRARPIGAGVLQHGFDIPLDSANSRAVFDAMLADATAMLGSLGVPCIAMTTNFRTMKVNWRHAWGTQLASGLYLLAGRYDTALVPNEVPYQRIDIIPWASHPLTNPWLGSDGFVVVDDGGEATRAEKAKAISVWPQAMRHLHVCFEPELTGTYENCCRCEKCIRTILAFRVAGCPRPSSFGADVTEQQIRRVRLTAVTKTKRWEELARSAAEAGLGRTGWARAIHVALRKKRWREFRNRLQQPFVPARDLFRRLLRGSSLSRGKLDLRQKTADQRASRLS